MPYTPTGLRWRQADTADAWSELTPSPTPNRGFVEARRYLFERPHPDYLIHIDDEPLTPVVGAWHICEWTPGFFAGEVTGELLNRDGATLAAFLLDVSPDPAKSGRETFGAMLDELWQYDPSLVIGSEPAMNLMGELGEHEDHWVAFARLRRYGPAFVRALVPIRSRPRRGLDVHRSAAPLHHVRRADRQTATSVLHSPAAALFAPSAQDLRTPYGPTRLDVPVVHETIDTAINRSMRALVRSVLRRTQGLRDHIEQLVVGERDSETRTSVAARWPVRKQFLNQCAASLIAVLRRPPFSQLPDTPVTAAGLTAIAADPTYARAWSLGWRAIRHGVDGRPSSERTWISPSWEIYERWCFARLGILLEASHPEWHWERRAAPHYQWLGRRGELRATLWLQPVFPARSAPVDGRWSVSRQREPDIVFSIDGPDGTRFVVLDAKYRVSTANVLDAMASAHIYQDSLRIGLHHPDTSLLLVPAGGGVPHLEQEAFQTEHQVGVVPFSSASRELPRSLSALLTSKR